MKASNCVVEEFINKVEMAKYSKYFGLICSSFLLLQISACTPDHDNMNSMTRQEHIHQMGHDVMPFELSKTVHVFRMTEYGGIQRVIVRDSASKDQIPMIQQHIKKEAAAFQRGDYSDPKSLHGDGMPGVKELQEGAAKINVKYADLPDGAEIVFETSDPFLLTAVHRWFGAQLSEHGSDAMAE